MVTLLIVDDESATRNGLQRHIRWERCGIDEIHVESNPRAALEACERYKPDIILSDIRMPGMTGIEMCTEARKRLPDVQIIFLSGYSDKEYLMSAINLSAVRYVEKPVNVREMEEAARQAVTAVKRLLQNTRITEEEALLARFQQALHRREADRLNELAEEIRALADQDSLPGRARKLYFRFGCLLGSTLYPERTAEENERIIRESLENEKSAEDLYAWFVKTIRMMINPAWDSGLSQPVARCVALIKGNLASETLTVQWLSERVYLTPTYLCSVFKREMEITPSQYILALRIEQAKQLLTDSRFSAAQIAKRVGYSDPKHFAKVFKRMTRQTPTEYRRSHV